MGTLEIEEQVPFFGFEKLASCSRAEETFETDSISIFWSFQSVHHDKRLEQRERLGHLQSLIEVNFCHGHSFNRRIFFGLRNHSLCGWGLRQLDMGSLYMSNYFWRIFVRALQRFNSRFRSFNCLRLSFESFPGRLRLFLGIGTRGQCTRVVGVP